MAARGKPNLESRARASENVPGPQDAAGWFLRSREMEPLLSGGERRCRMRVRDEGWSRGANGSELGHGGWVASGLNGWAEGVIIRAVGGKSEDEMRVSYILQRRRELRVALLYAGENLKAGNGDFGCESRLDTKTGTVDERARIFGAGQTPKDRRLQLRGEQTYCGRKGKVASCEDGKEGLGRKLRFRNVLGGSAEKRRTTRTLGVGRAREQVHNEPRRGGGAGRIAMRSITKSGICMRTTKRPGTGV